MCYGATERLLLGPEKWNVGIRTKKTRVHMEIEEAADREGQYHSGFRLCLARHQSARVHRFCRQPVRRQQHACGDVTDGACGRSSVIHTYTNAAQSNSRN